MEAFGRRRIWGSADVLARYGITSLEHQEYGGSISQIHFGGLRKAGELSFPEIDLILKANRHISSHGQKTSGGYKIQ